MDIEFKLQFEIKKTFLIIEKEIPFLLIVSRTNYNASLLMIYG